MEPPGIPGRFKARRAQQRVNAVAKRVEAAAQAMQRALTNVRAA
jgi:hypothetical protein